MRLLNVAGFHPHPSVIKKPHSLHLLIHPQITVLLLMVQLIKRNQNQITTTVLNMNTKVIHLDRFSVVPFLSHRIDMVYPNCNDGYDIE